MMRLQLLNSNANLWFGKREPRQPMTYQYVPILRWKKGEQTALLQLSSAGKTNVFPLIILTSEQYKPKKETKAKSSVPSADVFAEMVLNCWGKGAFYLDATALPDLPNAQHPLTDICASARLKGIELIPCTKLSASGPYNSAARAANNVDKAGIAIRLDLGDVANAPQWAGSWFIPIQETDLIIDIGGNTRMVQQMLPQAQATIHGLHLANQWRTVTFAGTTMPLDFSGMTQGVHLIPRIEKVIWQTIANGAPFRLDYGDYTTVPANAISRDIPWGYPINAKYTLNDDFLICKGISPTGLGGIDMDLQLIQHANTIVNYPSRNPLSHCWADTQIGAIAGKSLKPSNLATWVQYSVNRHIELVRHILP
jgi:hypothetical protein